MDNNQKSKKLIIFILFIIAVIGVYIIVKYNPNQSKSDLKYTFKPSTAQNKTNSFTHLTNIDSIKEITYDTIKKITQKPVLSITNRLKNKKQLKLDTIINKDTINIEYNTDSILKLNISFYKDTVLNINKNEREIKTINLHPIELNQLEIQEIKSYEKSFIENIEYYLFVVLIGYIVLK